MDANTRTYGPVETREKLGIDATKRRLYTVILEDIVAGEKPVELTRFNLDENYHRLILHMIEHLKDRGYEVDGVDVDNLKRRTRKQYIEMSFRSKRKTGLFRNKTEYGKTHTLWLGYTGDRSVLREVSFKIDGRLYPPNPALHEVYTIVKNKK